MSSSLKSLIVYCCSLLTATVASAIPVTLYSTSYESAEYTLGALSGQNGWIMYEFGDFSHQVVSSGPARSGSQSLRLGKLAGQGAYGTTQISGPFSTPLPQIVVEHSIYLDGPTGWNLGSSDYTFGVPFALYGPGDVFISQVPVSQGLHVQFAGLDVPISTDTWLDLKMVLDFPAQTATAYLNGNLIGTEPFANPASQLSLLEVTGLMGFNTPGPSPSFFFDDLKITAIPEPASLSLLAGVGVLALRRRANSQ